MHIHRSNASLRNAWDDRAESWLEWVRADRDDTYRRFHRDRFLKLVPPPCRATLDLGCGEGRMSRELAARGHRVTGVDASPRMIEAARTRSSGVDFRHADAADLPFADRGFDLVVAFMSLHDFDDLDRAIREAARVLEVGGIVCLAVVHPLNSSGVFAAETADAPFSLADSYLAESYYETTMVQEGAEMSFVGIHRPLHSYADALTGAGFVIERLCEVGLPDAAVTVEPSRRWQRIPLFLHMRAALRDVATLGSHVRGSASGAGPDGLVKT